MYRGPAIMWILIWAILVAAAFVIYTVLPTIAIRLYSNRVTKRVSGENGIALTFDDGPNPIYSEQLLDLLHKYDIKATFFVVGRKAIEHPEVIRRMQREGHAIGIHHYEHVSSWFLSPVRLRRQLKLSAEAVEKQVPGTVHLYRPPWGHFNLFSLFICRDYRCIMWTHILGDWKIANCERTLLAGLRQSKTPGSILLLHDCGETAGADFAAPRYMLEKLEIFLEECNEEEIEFFTLKNIDNNGAD